VTMPGSQPLEPVTTPVMQTAESVTVPVDVHRNDVQQPVTQRSDDGTPCAGTAGDDSAESIAMGVSHHHEVRHSPEPVTLPGEYAAARTETPGDSASKSVDIAVSNLPAWLQREMFHHGAFQQGTVPQGV
jgi:hypothetical protein